MRLYLCFDDYKWIPLRPWSTFDNQKHPQGTLIHVWCSKTDLSETLVGLLWSRALFGDLNDSRWIPMKPVGHPEGPRTEKRHKLGLKCPERHFLRTLIHVFCPCGLSSYSPFPIIILIKPKTFIYTSVKIRNPSRPHRNSLNLSITHALFKNLRAARQCLSSFL